MIRNISKKILLSIFFLAPALQVSAQSTHGLSLSSDYKIMVSGRTLPVFSTDVSRQGPASFSSFGLPSPSEVIITPSRSFKTFSILPASLGIQARKEGNAISFTLNQPANLTIELDGKIDRPFHLFANPPEKNAPDPHDPNVIFFGPGLHEVSTLRPQTGQHIYLAEGAVLRPIIPSQEQPESETNAAGKKEKFYAPLIKGTNVDHVRIDGRGVLDLSALPWHSRKTIWFEDSSNIVIEGIILLDAPDWGIGLLQCHDVAIRNIKQISSRENGDGIDICNSRNVLVEDCFIRSNDDAVCVKTLSSPPALSAKDITVRRCIIWNERARALGITSETKADISNVLFQDCDILHDFSDDEECAALTVLVSDSGTISNIRFEQIRVGDCRKKLVRCWIGEDGWSSDKTRGKIRDVTFQDIEVTGSFFPALEVFGFNREHMVQNVTFKGLKLNGKEVGHLHTTKLQTNEHVRDVQIVK